MSENPIKVSEKNILARPNETIGLLPASGQKITYQQRALYAALLFISKQQGDADRYQAFLGDLAALAKIEYGKNSKYIRESLDQIRNLTFKLSVKREVNGEIETEEATIGYIDKPGSIVRNGVETRIFWSLDPDLKARLLRPENNFTLIPLDVITLFKSGSSLALAEICYMYQTNYAGKGWGTTGTKPLEFWCPRILGHQVSEKYQYKYFKRDVLSKAVDEINENKLVPFTIEFVEDKSGKTVKGLEFKIFKKQKKVQEGEGEAEGSALENEYYLVSKIMQNVGGTRKDALEILRKYTDPKYVEKHLKAHLDQVANGFKPRSSIASFKARMKNDWESKSDAEQNTHASFVEFPKDSETSRPTPALSTNEDIRRFEFIEQIELLEESDRLRLFEAFINEGAATAGVEIFKKRGYGNAIAKNFLIDWVLKKGSISLILGI